MATVFKSRVDPLVGVALVVPPVSGVGVAVAGLLTGHGVAAMIGIGVLAFVAVLYLGFVWPITYTVDGDALHIRYGRARAAIPWAWIQEAEPTRDPASAPALSRERLRIRYQKPDGDAKDVLISPPDRAAFVRAIAAVSPAHEAAGERLTSARSHARER